MEHEVKLSLGLFSWKTKFKFEDLERDAWQSTVDHLRDYRFLYQPMEVENAGQVFSAVSKLRNNGFSDQLKALPSGSKARSPYYNIGDALTAFISVCEEIGSEMFENEHFNLTALPGQGYQWMFVAALTELRIKVVDIIRENCILYGISLPEQFVE